MDDAKTKAAKEAADALVKILSIEQPQCLLVSSISDVSIEQGSAMFTLTRQESDQRFVITCTQIEWRDSVLENVTTPL